MRIHLCIYIIISVKRRRQKKYNFLDDSARMFSFISPNTEIKKIIIKDFRVTEIKITVIEQGETFFFGSLVRI